jgi:hypothetical protein
MVFFDFETDGFDGPIVEAAYCDENGNIFEVHDVKAELDRLLELGEQVVFWDAFFLRYMGTHFDHVNLKGVYIFKSMFHFVLPDAKDSIAAITEQMLRRQHVGHAVQDACDLYECYKMLRRFQDKCLLKGLG